MRRVFLTPIAAVLVLGIACSPSPDGDTDGSVADSAGVETPDVGGMVAPAGPPPDSVRVTVVPALSDSVSVNGTVYKDSTSFNVPFPDPPQGYFEITVDGVVQTVTKKAGSAWLEAFNVNQYCGLVLSYATYTGVDMLPGFARTDCRCKRCNGMMVCGCNPECP